MGNCVGKSDEQQRNAAIGRKLAKDAAADEHTIKILLLGAGESGKSTFFKQMKLLYTDQHGFSAAEKQSFERVVYNNILGDMQTLIQATKSHTAIQNKEAADLALEIMQLRKNLVIDPEKGEKLKTVWMDPGMAETWENRGDIQVQDALEYFMDNIDKIAAEDYKPSDADILRTRVRTSGVVQETFSFNATKIDMIDVGGQRNERRKWINAFDSVTCVIFVAAVSEYNQVLYEDSMVNRQDEAINLFRIQLELDCFLDTPFLLFLNKDDIFRQKLTKIPFKLIDGDKSRNADYSGPECDPTKTYITEKDGESPEFLAVYDAVCEYLKAAYQSQAPQKRTQPIYTYFTTSTNTQNIKDIMDACKDIIMRGNLTAGGWLP